MQSLSRTFGGTVKLQSLCARVHEMALRLGPGAQLPKTLELRDELGVSMVTLTAVLRELEGRKIIVRRHGVGIFVSPQLHQKTVTLLCEATFLQGAGQSPFWDLLLDVARRRADSHNELLEVHLVTHDRPAEAPFQRGLTGEIESAQIHGIIGVSLSDDAVKWIEARRMPFVSLFGPHFAPTSAGVGINHLEIVRLGVQQLQSQGCGRIAAWLSTWQLVFFRSLLSASQNHNGWAGRALAGEPKLAQPQISWWSETEDLSPPEQGFELARRSFSAPRAQWPDGLVIGDDMMARGVLTALQSLGVEVGRDVKIATHANKNSPTLQQQSGVTRLEIDPAEIVETTFSLLETLMNGQTPPAAEIVLPPRARAV